MALDLLLQPQTLHTVSLETFKRWFVSIAEYAMYVQEQFDANAAESFVSRKVLIIQNYLESNVPKIFHDTLSNELLQALQECTMRQSDLIVPPYQQWGLYGRRTKVIGRMIETVFSKNLTRLTLDFDKMPPSSPATVSAKFESLTGLIQLDLFSRDIETLKEAEMNHLIQLLKQSHSLKHLTLQLKYGSTCDLLKCITDNCKLIEELDLQYNTTVNDDNVVLLSQLSSLRSVNLEDTAVSKLGIATLLLSCDNLEHINTGVETNTNRNSYFDYSIDSLVGAVSHIASFQEHSSKQFKLKSYKIKEGTSLEQLQLVIKMCPHIQKIVIERFHVEESDRAPALNALQELREVEFNCYRFYTDQLKNMLEVRGCNLVDLTLIGIDEVDLNALLYVNQVCPKLENLHLRQCFYKKTGAGISNCESNKIKILTIDAWAKDCRPTGDQLFFLLSKCPFIEYISIGKHVSLTDVVMLKVLDANPMIYLKKLSMAQSGITMLTVDRIIQNCINYPEILLKKDEIEYVYRPTRI